ncbi:MAG: PRC-barrel domain-containing protein [Rubrobacteraceae bacterium]
MEERGLVGIEARTADGEEVGRITEVLTDEESGEVTHVMVEREDQRFELPITAISLDAEADFATFHADRSDEEPGDHAGDEIEPEDAAPLESDVQDTRHEGQLVTEPESDEEAQSEADLVREDWEDETYTPADSGYPRTDAYIDPDTGEAEVDPAMNEGEEVGDDAAKLLDGTGLEVRAAKDGVLELTGAAATRQDLEESVKELMGLDGVREVDTTDVDVG